MRNLSLTDRRILLCLKKGRSTPKAIAKETEIGKDYVWQRLRLLELEGHIKKVDTGLYEYVERP